MIGYSLEQVQLSKITHLGRVSEPIYGVYDFSEQFIHSVKISVISGNIFIGKFSNVNFDYITDCIIVNSSTISLASVQNIIINQGKNIQIGSQSHDITFKQGCENISIQKECQNILFEQYCGSNYGQIDIQEKCENLTLGEYCASNKGIITFDQYCGYNNGKIELGKGCARFTGTIIFQKLCASYGSVYTDSNGDLAQWDGYISLDEGCAAGDNHPTFIAPNLQTEPPEDGLARGSFIGGQIQFQDGCAAGAIYNGQVNGGGRIILHKYVCYNAGILTFGKRCSSSLAQTKHSGGLIEIGTLCAYVGIITIGNKCAYSGESYQETPTSQPIWKSSIIKIGDRCAMSGKMQIGGGCCYYGGQIHIGKSSAQVNGNIIFGDQCCLLNGIIELGHHCACNNGLIKIGDESASNCIPVLPSESPNHNGQFCGGHIKFDEWCASTNGLINIGNNCAFSRSEAQHSQGGRMYFEKMCAYNGGQIVIGNYCAANMTIGPETEINRNGGYIHFKECAAQYNGRILIFNNCADTGSLSINYDTGEITQTSGMIEIGKYAAAGSLQDYTGSYVPTGELYQSGGMIQFENKCSGSQSLFSQNPQYVETPEQIICGGNIILGDRCAALGGFIKFGDSCASCDEPIKQFIQSYSQYKDIQGNVISISNMYLDSVDNIYKANKNFLTYQTGDTIPLNNQYNITIPVFVAIEGKSGLIQFGDECAMNNGEIIFKDKCACTGSVAFPVGGTQLQVDGFIKFGNKCAYDSGQITFGNDCSRNHGRIQIGDNCACTESIIHFDYSCGEKYGWIQFGNNCSCVESSILLKNHCGYNYGKMLLGNNCSSCLSLIKFDAYSPSYGSTDYTKGLISLGDNCGSGISNQKNEIIETGGLIYFGFYCASGNAKEIEDIQPNENGGQIVFGPGCSRKGSYVQIHQYCGANNGKITLGNDCGVINSTIQISKWSAYDGGRISIGNNCAYDCGGIFIHKTSAYINGQISIGNNCAQYTGGIDLGIFAASRAPTDKCICADQTLGLVAGDNKFGVIKIFDNCATGSSGQSGGNIVFTAGGCASGYLIDGKNVGAGKIIIKEHSVYNQGYLTVGARCASMDPSIQSVYGVYGGTILIQENSIRERGVVHIQNFSAFNGNIDNTKGIINIGQNCCVNKGVITLRCYSAVNGNITFMHDVAKNDGYINFVNPYIANGGDFTVRPFVCSNKSILKIITVGKYQSVTVGDVSNFDVNQLLHTLEIETDQYTDSIINFWNFATTNNLPSWHIQNQIFKTQVRTVDNSRLVFGLYFNDQMIIQQVILNNDWEQRL